MVFRSSNRIERRKKPHKSVFYLSISNPLVLLLLFAYVVWTQTHTPFFEKGWESRWMNHINTALNRTFVVFLPPLSIVQIPTKKKAAHCAMLIFNRKKAEREREKKSTKINYWISATTMGKNEMKLKEIIGFQLQFFSLHIVKIICKFLLLLYNLIFNLPTTQTTT